MSNPTCYIGAPLDIVALEHGNAGLVLFGQWRSHSNARKAPHPSNNLASKIVASASVRS